MKNTKEKQSAKLLEAITKKLPIVGGLGNRSCDLNEFFKNEYPCSFYQKKAEWNYSPFLTNKDKKTIQTALDDCDYYELYRDYIRISEEYKAWKVENGLCHKDWEEEDFDFESATWFDDFDRIQGCYIDTIIEDIFKDYKIEYQKLNLIIKNHLEKRNQFATDKWKDIYAMKEALLIAFLSSVLGYELCGDSSNLLKLKNELDKDLIRLQDELDNELIRNFGQTKTRKEWDLMNGFDFINLMLADTVKNQLNQN